MLKRTYIAKAIVAMFLVMIMPAAFASLSLTGTVDETKKSSKYSLSNINKYSKKSFSLSLLRSSLSYKGSLLNQPDNNNSIITFNGGNTTYVLPYKLKLKAPKFKTPTQP